MDTFHLIMRTVGPESQKRSSLSLSFQQFRTMKILERHEGASLSFVAEHMGATPSAMSKVVDSLVEQGYIYRRTSESDRRKLILAVTDPGKQAMDAIHAQVLSRLAERLTGLSPCECEMVYLVMDLLRSKMVTAQSEITHQL